MIETALRAYLAAQPSVSGVVATRIYPQMLPPKPTYPAITYAGVSKQSDRDFQGPNGRETTRVSVNCWAESYEAAKSLAQTIRGLLDGYQGAMDGDTVKRLELANEIDFYEPDTRVHRVMTDYFITNA